MTLTGFILRNAVRNKRRLALTLSSVAVSLFLLTVLQVMLRGFTDPAATEQSAALGWWSGTRCHWPTCCSPGTEPPSG